MAKQKKPRNKKYGIVRAKTNNITSVVSRVISKFQIIGDQYHAPLAFHYNEIQLYLKGMDLKVGYQHANEYLFEHKKPWSVIGLFFTKDGDNIEVHSARAILEDTTLYAVGEQLEDVLRGMRLGLFSDMGTESNNEVIFYGYFITYGGEDINVDSIENQLAPSFLKITKDLTVFPEKEHVFTPESILAAIKADKYSAANRNALSTEYKEEV